MSAFEASVPERVVLCGPDGQAIGTADKGTVHHERTPLHLAFSCYVFDARDRVLMTRRAHTKKTWPGVRTNSCCGHPAPGEPMPDAVSRRLRYELGIVAATIDLLVPAFRYRATMPDGTVENELCPIYRATVADEAVVANPDEVAEAWWTPWLAVASESGAESDRLSPWSLLQLEALRRLDGTPGTWPVADPADLPVAARS
ncbi:isopentenyl-diphosphate Delta-isomerase [Jatrophihabitans telluris]|uniref:Isopentenyl-diphosphate Delta-isomerase n=1 Tax=Jatrophihabitans telluris TaxID=2038343 RepID=A0ABY4QUB8_9ACTN|nr:isopentenyl-diphosphate Delta-isomerase [Jatrophihabitans telluris]UQX86852.1 isopentenyl-diphosphate Delta-isomerase [Jatrophihabitans telluris]